MAKKRKRMSKEELRSPDKIEETLTRWWKWVEDHKRAVLAFVVVVLVAVVAAFVLEELSKASNNTSASSIRQAVKPLLMPVIEDKENADQLVKELKLPVYATRKAKLEAGLASIDKFLETGGDSDAAKLMRFTRGSLLVALGKTEEGAKALKAWMAGHADSPIAPVVMGHLADANLALGKIDQARAVANQAVAGTKGSGKVLALLRLGDLSNPLMVKTGDAGQARKHYEAAETLIKDKKDHPLAQMVALRLAVLP